MEVSASPVPASRVHPSHIDPGGPAAGLIVT